MPSNNYREFLRAETPESTGIGGNFVDTEGNIIGSHKGIENFTIGQRRGLGVAAGKPLYVTSIDMGKKEVALGEIENLMKRRLTVTNLLWHGKGQRPSKGNRTEIKYRYRSRIARAKILFVDDEKLVAQFDVAQKALTPGQEAVFYNGDIVLGAGTIERAE